MGKEGREGGREGGVEAKASYAVDRVGGGAMDAGRASLLILKGCGTMEGMYEVRATLQAGCRSRDAHVVDDAQKANASA